MWPEGGAPLPIAPKRPGQGMTPRATPGIAPHHRQIPPGPEAKTLDEIGADGVCGAATIAVSSFPIDLPTAIEREWRTN